MAMLPDTHESEAQCLVDAMVSLLKVIEILPKTLLGDRKSSQKKQVPDESGRLCP